MKLTLIKKVENKDEKLIVELLPISGDVRTKLRIIEKEHRQKVTQEIEKILKNPAESTIYFEYDELFAIGIAMANAEGENAQIAHAQHFKKSIANISKIVEEDFCVIRDIEIAKVLIDTRKLNDENKALIESDSNGEFWQAQDIAEVAKAHEYFRK